MTLEREEPQIVRFGTPEVKLKGSIRPRFGNCMPQEPGHGSKVVESLVGTSILVVSHMLEPQDKNSGDRSIALEGQANPRTLALALDEISKPRQGSRWQLVTPAG